MGCSPSQHATAHFYEWEKRGRGWHTFGFPIEPEPDFVPFFRHISQPATFIDDSKRPSIFQRAANLFRTDKEPEDDTEAEEIPVTAWEYLDEEGFVVYSIALPKEEKIKITGMEQLLLMLSYTNNPVSFEIVGTDTTITIQCTCRQTDAGMVYEQIHAYFPAAIIDVVEPENGILLEYTQTAIIDFGLQEECMRPLRMASDAAQDPYIGLFAVLEQIGNGERGVVQVLFKGAVNPWSESMMRSVTDSHGGSFFADAPEMVKVAQEKISSPIYAVCIKVVGQSATSQRAVDIAYSIGAALVQQTRSNHNSLFMLPLQGYDPQDRITDVWLRKTHRSGMLLNCKELATLVHLPTPEIHSQKLVRDTKKTKAAPESAYGHEFVLGINTHHGNEEMVTVPAHVRLRHTHIIGATGTGKSTLLLSMIAQDMEQGNGVAVIDPHGDLIESILAYVPENRIQDVIVIDPADGEYPVGFNILSAHSEIEKDILSSDLVAAFKRLSTSWGDQMNSVFANAILAFLESTQGGTLADLRRFLVEKSFRDAYLKTVADQNIVYYWQHEYPLLKSSSIGSILTRLDSFLRPKLIRNMVAQKKGLDFENILDTRKILLIKLSQGLIGAENSFLLGTFFVSKMYQAAMARQAKSKANRSDYFLYIDEFQNFITPSMSYILSGARKYHLGLILAHQDMQQLQKYDTELASSVVVNAGTRICFRLGDVDAKRFASGFSYFDAEDLENLHTGEAIVRIEQPNFDFNLSTIPLPEIEEDIAHGISQAVITVSRNSYGTSRETVEQEISATHTPPVKEPQPILPTIPVVEVEQSIQPPVTDQIPFVPVEIPKPAPVQKTETQHRYLQTLIKRMAESRGYKAAIEQVTPDGNGRVDVSLERNGKRIACEVSVTTGDEWEVHNIEKCLAAGYDEVIVCSNEIKNLRRIKTRIESALSKEQQSKVLLYEAQEVFKYFDSQIIEEHTTEKVVKGYRIKVEFDASTVGEMTQKQEGVMKAVTTSMRKKREVK